MIVPAVGGLASSLGNVAGNAASGNPEALSNAAGGATPAGGAGGLGGAQGVGLGGVQGGGLEGAGTVEGASAGEGGGTGFSGALSEAISSLETSQQNASTASQALATGTVADPEAAVTTVEDAALAMQLASQIRTKATEAAQTIFNTQV